MGEKFCAAIACLKNVLKSKYYRTLFKLKMPKRKQKGDFQKTKLKVGRKITKGGNVTDTSFKTKKIIAPQQKLDSLADKPLVELLLYLNTTNFIQKKETLHKIDKYILDNLDSLFLYFPDVLTRLSKVVLESDPELSLLGVKVITTCVSNLSEVQYGSFASHMMLQLNVMMSHGAMHVKKTSLELLEALVNAHPKVLTSQTKILFSLLNMISKEKNGIRTLVEHVSRTMTSATWHQTVLQHIHHFLQELMEIEETKFHLDLDSKMTDSVAHPDCGKVDMSWYSNTTPSNEEELANFVRQLLQILFVLAKDALKSVKQAATSDGSLVSKSEAKHLNIIIQLMCYVGEMFKVKINLEENKEEYELFHEIISSYISGFPYEQQGRVDPNKVLEFESYQLNLGICYLFTVFVMDSVNQTPIVTKMMERMSNFLQDGFRAALHMSKRSVNLILKFSKNIIQSKYAQNDWKNCVIGAIYEVLQLYRNSQYEEAIYSFFIDISLGYRYKDALETLALKSWFETFVNELTRMKEKNQINVKLLKCIQQLCHRKCPEFIDVLKQDNEFPKDLFHLLKHDNEEFQNTIVHMILAVDYKEPAAFLQDMSDFICSHEITLNVTQKLIRQLYSRYSSGEKKEKLLFVKFLLNTACDMNYEMDDATIQNESLLHVVNTSFDCHAFRVYPSTKWKAHKPIFEECLQYLLTYSGDVLVDRALVVFAQAFLYYFNELQFIPAHTVLALLNLGLKIRPLLHNEQVSQFLPILYFAAFLYLSVVTTEAFDEAVSYTVPELTQILLSYCDPRTALVLIQMHQRNVLKNAYQDVELYHFMKTVLFLKNQNRLDNYYLEDFFQAIEGRVQQSALLVPVWRAIFS
ncbi:hypothetical protein JTE90_002111 [Oedothorax gibbosus]|uniref:Uncharacterized protein n=1 Tax=Oedothorax gibbosus TaxID=931172 RepID=A0AAV6V9I1_9ARAC|nr:hypothetical protein JTE90_002111 [Oedothorax gibbosus]